MNHSKLCLFLLFAAFSVHTVFGADWKAAAALEVKPGIESVKVKTLQSTNEKIILQYEIPIATAIATPQKNKNSSITLQTGNSISFGLEGEPVLPIIPVKVIIPEGRIIDNVTVNTKVKSAIHGQYDIAYQTAYTPLIKGAKIRTVGPKASIYKSDNKFPGQACQVVSVQKLHGVNIAYINISPVIYYPLSKNIVSINNLELEITTKPANSKTMKTASFPKRIDTKALGIENPEVLDTYKSAENAVTGSAKLGICNSSDSYSYVVVTNTAIRDATTDYTIRDLVSRRQAQGFTATIVTIDAILAGYTGTDNAQKLRNFIIDAYTNWETQYVLLGGDVSIIPMRKLYQTLEGGEEIPSDLYYQCLDGTYNYDADNYWGESTDGIGGGEVDLLAEVSIGRASAETPEEMSNFVYKTLKYETDSEGSSYLHKALMCGELLGFGGVSEYATASMEEVRNGSSANGYTTVGFSSSAAMTTDDLYDTVGYEWPASEIVSIINSNQFSIINHLGHANYNYVLKFYNSTADALTNTNPLFLYSQGCIPGNFEEDCIAEHLTTSTRSGLWGGVMNSRYGWGAGNSTDGPSQRFDRQFWDAYFAENKNFVGAINADSHEDNINTISDDYTRWCMYETNLFGDPCTIMRGKIEGPYVQYASNNANDHLGNNDGIINPGETIELPVTVANSGTSVATSVSGTLSTTDSYVAITQNNANFGDIACCGANAASLTNYIIQVSPSCPAPRTVTFTLQLKSGANTWNSTFQLTINRSNTISGTVTAFTGGTPVANATINYSGTSSGTIITDANGHFSKSIISGTYSIFAAAAGYLNTVAKNVILPPDNTTLSFTMMRPLLSLSKSSVNASVAPGATKTDVIAITNTGDTTLFYSTSLKETTSIKLTGVNKTYDQSHYAEIAKGEEDRRIGDPVKVASGGPDEFGYTWKDSKSQNGPVYVWNDISATGTLLSSISGCDDCFQSQPISFPFNYYGVNYNSIYVSSNGCITLNAGDYSWSNYALPSSSAPATLIAAFHDDLYPGSSGDIYFKDYGNHAVIQYSNVATYSGDGTITFQIVLNADGSIIFYYNSYSGTTNSSTVGIQNLDGSIGLNIAYNTAYIEPGLAVEIRNLPSWITVSPINDTIGKTLTKNLTFNFDAAGLAIGTYTATLDLNHNDPTQTAPVAIPITLVVKNSTAPIITSQPINATVEVGQTAQFIITAAGENLQYQWQLNGTDITGANSAAYTTPVTVLSDNNNVYRCAVSNSAGSDTSSNAHLYVIPHSVDPPVILTQPADIAVFQGSSAAFAVVASGFNMSYQWMRNTIAISGATNSSYNLSNVSMSDSGAKFSCVVTNAAGSVTSIEATLTVNAQKNIQLQVISIGTSAGSVSQSANYTAENIIIGSSVNGVVEGNRFRLFLK